MRRYIIFMIALFVAAQVFCKQYNLLYRPVKYDKIIDETSAMHEGKEQGNVIWIVLSDRANNTTYASNRRVKPTDHLNFLEACYVTEERGAWAHVVQDNEISVSPPATSPQAIDKGWIQKRHLVLSPFSIVTENQIPRKALIMNSVETLEKISRNESDADLAVMRQGPGTQYTQIDTSRVFNFYFIYNSDRLPTGKADWYLIAKQPQLFSGQNLSLVTQNARQRFKGWVDARRINEWNTRVAAEINWNWKAIKERQKKHIQPAIFTIEGLNAAREYAKGNVASSQVNKKYILNTQSDPYAKVSPLDGSPACLAQIDTTRPVPQIRRNPILESTNQLRPNSIDSLIRTMGFIGDLATIKGAQLSNYEDAIVRKDLENAINGSRQVNIMFVVDATNSMRPYLPVVGQAITQAVNRLQHSRQKFKFGAVVYRDYGDTESATIPCELGNESLIKDTFARLQAQSNQKPVAEAMYRGIHRALLEGNLKPDETNVLILIGDVGNHREDQAIDLKKIQAQLTQYRTSFFAIQVNYRSDKFQENYQDFVEQNKNLMAAVESNLTQELQAHQIQRKHHTLTKTGENQYEDRGIVFGEIKGLTPGQHLSVKALEQQIVSDIILVDDQVNAMVDAFKAVKTGGALEAYSENIYWELINAGVNQSVIQKLEGDRFQLYQPSYVPYKIQGMRYPLYKNVILISQDHLAALVEALKPLGRSQDNMGLQAAWRNYIRFMIGDISANQMDEWLKNDMSRISELGFGIPTNSRFSQIKYFDLADMSEGKRRELISYLGNKADRLEKKLYNDSSRFQIDEVKYFWVSEDDLP